MPLSMGDKLGPYEILAPIGAGGMGEVYKARDTKLDREVAIKVLPAAVAQDPERLARFEREAKVLASLNHPNIAQIYGVEERALVMELVPGETLKGPLPLETALNYAKQIADALEAAHEKGITHRDLKPANVMITPAGVVKVLDFGLASVPGREGASNPANSPTMTMAATQAGWIIGTAAYMSPEQAAGKVVDMRSDIWSFGVVLWEMLTGARLFEGETISHTLAHVLTAPIDCAGLPASTPAPIMELLKRCLDRDPKTRLRDIGEARIAITKYLANPKSATVVRPPTYVRSPSRWALAVAAALALVAFSLAVTLWAPWRAAPELPKSVRFQIARPPGVRPSGFFSLSPDGTKLAFHGSGSDGIARLWVRSMDTLDSRALAGTEGVATALFFWSYDSRFVAFNAAGKLKKVDVAGGPPQTLCDVSGTVVGGSWNRDGVIIFGTNTATGIQRVSSAGGAPSPVTAMNAARKDSHHSYPVFLPDARHFLYFVLSLTSENSGVFVGSLDSKPDQQDPKRLVATAFGPGFVRSPEGKRGTILFQRDGTLLAQPFDLRTVGTAGEAVPVAEQLGSFLAFGYFSASDNGTLAYSGDASGGNSQLGWFDRQGKSLGGAGTAHDYMGPTALALSPDGTRVAGTRTEGANLDIWLTSLSRGSDTRFTFDPAFDRFPIWSPNGDRIAFSSTRAGSYDLYQHASNGAGQDELLFKSDHTKAATDWSRDGRFLLYMDSDPKTKYDLWVLPMDGAAGERKPIPFLRTEFSETTAKFSSDGHWVAYDSDESGRNEIYVRPFPAPLNGGGKWMVSQGGGTQPHWRGDGKEIYYMAPDGNVMAVSVSASGAAFQPATPAALFKAPLNPPGWDVTADGKRFLFLTLAGDTAQAPFTVVLNWMSLLKK